MDLLTNGLDQKLQELRVVYEAAFEPARQAMRDRDALMRECETLHAANACLKARISELEKPQASPATMDFWLWLDRVGLELRVKKVYGYYMVSVAGTEMRPGFCTGQYYGRSVSLADAMQEHVEMISGKHLVIDAAIPDKRREFQVPILTLKV